MILAATAALLFVAGYGSLTLIGTAAGVVLWPRRWLPYAVLAAPHLGWAVLVAIGYPLNAVLPFRVVVQLCLGVALLIGVVSIWRSGGRWRRWARWPRPWREALPPAALGVLTYTLAATVHGRQGALTAMVADSDVEHFADVIDALLHFPIGWSVSAQQGLEATPVGLAYHYVHALLSATTGIDTATTALASHFLLLALAVQAVYLFGRSLLRLPPSAARLATALYALGGLPLVVASFGWGQQTAAMAAVPFGLAALRAGLVARDTRSWLLAGLAGSLAAGSLYLATAPLVGGAAVAMAAVAGLQDWRAAHGGRGHTRAAAALRPLARLLAMGVVVGAAGLLSHLSAAAYLLDRSTEGLLRADELSGRSTHVATFAGPAQLLGVAPLDLFGTVEGLAGQPLLEWPGGAQAVAALAAAGAAVLLSAGVATRARRCPYAIAILLVVAGYELYLRWLRPFPYGEFKLLSSTWFLVPSLAGAGAWWLLSARGSDPGRGALRGPRPSRGRAAPTLGRGVLRAGRLVAWPATASFAAGVALVGIHAVRFLSLPWGGVLPETEMAAARAIAQAVPRGAAVYVSGQLTPLAATGGNAVMTAHRAGWASPSARAGYLTRRWRGAVTALLAFDGRHPYGLVQRHSAELRLPADPRSTDFVLLDRAEDPRLYGLLPSDEVASAGTLRLYRQAGHLTASLHDLAPVDLPPQDASSTPGVPDGPAPVLHLRATADGLLVRHGDQERLVPGPRAPLPPPVLPVGESLPGRRQDGARPVDCTPALGRERCFEGAPAASAAPPAPGPGERSRGQLLIGLQAIAPAHVALTLRPLPGGDAAGVAADGSGEGVLRRTLVLTPGLTWYTAPELPWPVEVQIVQPSPPGDAGAEGATGNAGGGPPPDGATSAVVRAVQVIALPAAPEVHRPMEEALERSEAGTRWPLLTVASGSSPARDKLILEAWYSYLGPREADVQLRVHDAATLWRGGASFPTTLHLGPGGRRWRAELAAGQVPQQLASDGRHLAAPPGAWAEEDGRDGGRRWLWLEIGPDRQATLHEPALVELELGPAGPEGPGQIGVVNRAPAAVVLPLVAEPAPATSVEHGTLVKGSGEDLFYVDRGTLRWVPSVEVLERRNIPWHLRVLEDDALWRLPVGMPLS